ncbi:RINT-1 / TIP-1 family protein, partial [Opisthorchis viverrini]
MGDLADKYTEQLNELTKAPGRVEQKLTNALTQYDKKIQELRSIALLSDGSDLSRLYRSTVSLIDRITEFLKATEAVEQKYLELVPTAQDLYQCAKPAIIEYEETARLARFSELQKYVAYYERNASVLLSSVIDAARLLNDNELLTDGLKQYLAFIHNEATQDSRCISTLMNETASHQNCLNNLKFLVRSFEQLLEDMGFPVNPAPVFEKENAEKWTDEQLKSFAEFFQQLASVEPTHLNILLNKPLADIVSLPMHIILHSLEKRFRYHFTGSRKTNRLDKPEWYMTQILQWIRHNDYVLTIVDRDFLTLLEQHSGERIRTQFIRGLVVLLLDKLQYDLGITDKLEARYTTEFELTDNWTKAIQVSSAQSTQSTKTPSGPLVDNLEWFGHLVDIILQTDARLTQLAYPSGQPRPTDILCLPVVFALWLSVEQRLALVRLDSLLNSSTAWSVVGDGDVRPQCAEDFIALLHAVGLRGRQLHDKLARSRFLRVQMNLIYMFHNKLEEFAHSTGTSGTGTDNPHRVSGIKGDVPSDTNAGMSTHRRLFGFLGPQTASTGSPARTSHMFSWFGDTKQRGQTTRWIAVLNALTYTRDALLESANDPYYVTFWEDSSLRAFLRQPDPWMTDLGLDGARPVIPESKSLDDNPALEHESSTGCPKAPLGVLHGGVFHQALNFYQSTIDEMLEETVQSVMREICHKAQGYTSANDYWLRPGSASAVTGGIHVDTISLELSGTASVLLICLRDQLFFLCKSLHPRLFARAWRRIAGEMDNLLYHKLILVNRFSPAGAAQLRFDLTHCLFPLFALYTDRPESCFPQSRDAIILLNLLRGSAELLRNNLRERMSGTQADNNPLGPLIELGVFSMTPEEAELVLSLREIPD